MSGAHHVIPKIKGFKRNDIIAALKNKIWFDSKWTKAALLKLGDQQTEHELKKAETIDENNFGFDISNAAILTFYYKKVKSGEVLTDKEYRILGMMLGKYAAQLAALSNPEKLANTVKEFYSLERQKK